MEIRPVSEDDAPFLVEMTLLAAFPPGPLPEGASEMPRSARWTREWGRTGDAGVVAQLDGERVGAAWCRLFDEPIVNDGTGNSIPDVAIAVSAEHRSVGVGGALLRALEREAAAAGHTRLCLTVNERNPALRLYERAGYRLVRSDGEALTMARSLERQSRF